MILDFSEKLFMDLRLPRKLRKAGEAGVLARLFNPHRQESLCSQI
jgi:hypothetical protein